jgi:hypothetical protein
MTPLHQLGSWIRELFAAIPLPVVRGMFVLSIAAVLVWVIRLPRSAARAHPESAWNEDLRLWAAVALLIQIAIYALL